MEYFFGIIIWNIYGLYGYIVKMINKFKGKSFFLYFENLSFFVLYIERICNVILVSLDLICWWFIYVFWMVRGGGEGRRFLFFRKC